MNNMKLITVLSVGALACSSAVCQANDANLFNGIFGVIAQGMQQQAQRQQEPPPGYDNGERQFRVEDDAAERLHFRQEIQRRLNMLGYVAGNPDGRFGAQSRTAIAAFQTSIGRTPTGKITESEVAVLYDRTNGGVAPQPTRQSPAIMQPTIAAQPVPSPSTNASADTIAPSIALEPTVPASAIRVSAPAPVDAIKPVAATVDDSPVSIAPSIPLDGTDTKQ